MSVVVENLNMALNCQELLHFKPSEYERIIQAADPPLIYKCNMELIQILTKGVQVNSGKTDSIPLSQIGTEIWSNGDTSTRDVEHE
ncbi:hypothetical protein Tco_0280829 [Tanacetum coccineum]